MIPLHQADGATIQLKHYGSFGFLGLWAVSPPGYQVVPTLYFTVSQPGYQVIPSLYFTVSQPGYQVIPSLYFTVSQPGYQVIPSLYFTVSQPGYQVIPSLHFTVSQPGYQVIPTLYFTQLIYHFTIYHQGFFHSMHSILDNVYDIIYTCLMSYPGVNDIIDVIKTLNRIITLQLFQNNL